MRAGESFHPSHAELFCLVGSHERPDTAAKSRTERRRGDRAKLARLALQRDGLRHLVAEQCVGGLLRVVDEGPELTPALRGQGVESRGQDAAVLFEDVIEPAEQVRRREARRRTRDRGAEAPEGVR